MDRSGRKGLIMEAINSQERSSLKKMVIQEIKQYIMDHQLKAGDKFPTERKLTEMYGVSRSVVREALSYLENTGVIRIRQGQGAFLKETNMTHLLENFFFLWEINGGKIEEIQSLRMIFETAAIDEILKVSNIESLTVLHDVVKEGNASRTKEDYRKADISFHVALLEATGNNLFIQMSHVITQYFFASEHISPTLEEYQKAMDEHEAIMHAIKNKEADRAKSILAQHMQNIKS